MDSLEAKNPSPQNIVLVHRNGLTEVWAKRRWRRKGKKSLSEDSIILYGMGDAFEGKGKKIRERKGTTKGRSKAKKTRSTLRTVDAAQTQFLLNGTWRTGL